MTASTTMAADAARMRALYFDGRFGWLHAGSGPAATGVVICGALAQEEICTRHGMLLLAERFAAAGLPTLRFDYRGTGDSAPTAPSVETMIADIARAVDALRQETGVGAVVLCGLRAGATLAAKALGAIDGVAGVALLAPILSGAHYLRDLGVSVRFSPLALLDPVPPATSAAPLNTNGFHWSAALRDEIRALDMAAMPAPAMPVLIAPQHANPRTASLVAVWRAAGTPLTEHAFTDYPAFMRDPTTHVMPDATFAATVRWVHALDQRCDVVTPRAVAATDRLVLGDIEEHPLRLGPDGATFAILCRPHDRSPAPVAALMLHEGSSHHIGNGGAQVPLARRLAAHGFASLRLDLTGMGDSPGAPGHGRPFSDPARLGEAIAGVDALAAIAPGGIVASGLCSGAEMAYHAALADARIVGTLLVNMPAIGWDPLAETGGVAPPTKRTLKSYWRAIRAGGVRRVVLGQVDIGGVSAALARRARGAMALRLRRLARRGHDPAHLRARRQMRALAERGVYTLFLFSDDDPGLPEVRAQLGGENAIAAFAPARIAVFAHADHHFNGSDIRRRYDAVYLETLQTLSQILSTHR